MYIRIYSILAFFMACALDCASQNKLFIGYLKNAKDSLAVQQAEIIYQQKVYPLNNKDGRFEIELNGHDSTIIINALGYRSRSCQTSKGQKTIYILPLDFMMKEIQINGNLNTENISSATGSVKIPLAEIRNLPKLLGETDILKSLYLFPGVQSGGESSTGFSVRGGNFDQNLILLDDALVYNPSHLFGFLSTFNPSYISDVRLIKSNIPAEYGGAASAVVDISSDKTIPSRISGSGSVGFIAPSLKLSVPIIANKLALIVSGRRTFIDQIIKQFDTNSNNIKKGTNYYFYDLNAKLIFKPIQNLCNETSVYAGQDVFDFVGKSNFNMNKNWSNLIFSNKLTYTFSPQFQLKASFSISSYQDELKLNQNTNNILFESRISNSTGKLALNYTNNKDLIFTNGVQFTQSGFSPANNSMIRDTSSYKLGLGDHYRSRSFALFSQLEKDLNEKIKFNVGLRITYFQQLGPFSRLLFDQNNTISDTMDYKTDKELVHYIEFEPRLGMCYSLTAESSLKFSLTRNAQFQHLIPTSTQLSSDVWISSTPYIKPQTAYHFSAGYFRNFDANQFETYVESYAKWMNNVPEYNDQLDYLALNSTRNFDQNLSFGNAYSIGLEFFCKKKTGRLTGWISYTLSQTKIKIEGINSNQWFSSKYDKTNNLVIVANYTLNKKWTANAEFTYLTGDAMTVPVSRYLLQGNIMNVYSAKNAYRMPAYHRLDVGFSYQHLKTNRHESTFNFSIYNLYSHLNPYMIFFTVTGDLKKYNLEINARQITLFPILPSVSWTFKF